MNIVSMVVILTPSVPPIIRAMFTVPNVALQNTMACRVYRLLKLGIIRDDTESLTLRSERSDNFKLPYIVNRRNTFDDSQGRRTGPMDNTDVSTSTTIHTAGHDSKMTGMLPMHININTDVEIDNGSSDQIKTKGLA